LILAIPIGLVYPLARECPHSIVTNFGTATSKYMINMMKIYIDAASVSGNR
jgi:hypothetical protein